MPPFGFGLSMPSLRKAGGGAAPVTPISLRAQDAICQTTALAGDTLEGGTLFFQSIVQGDLFVLVYSDDSGAAPYWEDFPSAGALSGPFLSAKVGPWYIATYVAQVTDPEISPTIQVDTSTTSFAYVFLAGWQLRNSAETLYPTASVVATSPTTGTPQSFSVTTTASNSCVLGIAYSTPLPTPSYLQQINTFVLPSGWQSIQRGNSNGDPAYFAINKLNTATAGTISVNASPTDGVNTNVLRIEILK